MHVTATGLPEVLILEPQTFGDDRGFFLESYNRKRFGEAVGRDLDFVQDNHSRSAKGVLRGLHFQLEPKAQGKLIRVVAGAIFDVAVDVRRSSPRFGQWIGVELSVGNRRQLWIPEGFAHGFLTLSDSADVLYKASDFYSPSDERSVIWNDPTIAIDWPLEGEPVLSAKDAGAPLLAAAATYD